MSLFNIFNKTPLIEFHADPKIVALGLPPKPAIKKAPEWYKSIPAMNTKARHPKSHLPQFTVKKCLPFIDAMSLGYVLLLQTDLYVITNHDCSVLEVNPCAAGGGGGEILGAERHGWGQVKSDKFPGFKQDPIKFVNHWRITTRSGWSCLFTPPLNHLDQRFECLAGVVDTDNYPGLINFPAVWKKPNYEGVIPAGTPLVQVIPFKRSSIKSKLHFRESTAKEMATNQNLVNTQMSRDHVYNVELREPR